METKCPICDLPVQPGDARCPACGFKLSGSTQKFAPISVEEVAPAAQATAAAAPTASATFEVVRGPQRGQIFELDGERLTIGRNPKCGIFLNDMTASRHHADVFADCGRFVIEDANSFNGVWVNNQSVERCTLKSGDVIQIGTFCLLFKQR